MHDAQGHVIYVGKAKNLKKRLTSYFRGKVDVKTAALVRALTAITFTVTHTENEALLLENNFIKKYRPRYNVLLRDSKSYPYIALSQHKHPRVSAFRGQKARKGDCFGPYSSGQTVRDSLYLIQKIFQVRSCSDRVYSGRTRPCLLYQVKRCLGPCVSGLVTDTQYQKQVDLARLFLQGKDQQVLDQLVADMQQASDELAFEKAAVIRDQIQSIGKLREKQTVSVNVKQDLDVVGCYQHASKTCLHVLQIREGRIYSSRSYFPIVPAHSAHVEVIRAFLLEIYLNTDKQIKAPEEIILDCTLSDADELGQAFSSVQGRRVKINSNPRTHRQQFMELAIKNAKVALGTHEAQSSTYAKRLAEFEKWLDLQTPVERMECFDISHTQGEATVGSCVVFDRDGPLTSSWRRYNIEGITGGDDYAAMAQVMTRRFSQMQENTLPDVLFIDGGKGQLTRVKQVLEAILPEQGYSLPVLVGIAKGVRRKPGEETLFINDAQTIRPLEAHSPALHLIQHMRDESHRFAITGHRSKRGKVRLTSSLEEIPGVGHKRRQMLLSYLGGLQEVKTASATELAKVPGVSQALAERIYAHLHGVDVQEPNKHTDDP